jgi:hypothetical protein
VIELYCCLVPTCLPTCVHLVACRHYSGVDEGERQRARSLRDKAMEAAGKAYMDCGEDAAKSAFATVSRSKAKRYKVEIVQRPKYTHEDVERLARCDIRATCVM